jgi:penicillin-binding protein 1A
MKQILADKPVKVFVVPENVVFAKIDAKTGQLAKPGDINAVFEAFKEGTAPITYTEQSAPAMDDFFKTDLDAEPM